MKLTRRNFLAWAGVGAVGAKRPGAAAAGQEEGAEGAGRAPGGARRRRLRRRPGVQILRAARGHMRTLLTRSTKSNLTVRFWSGQLNQEGY